MTKLILKALRPIIVPLLVEAMEQRDRNRPELQHGAHLAFLGPLADGERERIKENLSRLRSGRGGGRVRY